jgi:glutathione S-transferase
MPTVYGANASPFVRKVRVFLVEKNIPYDLETVFPVNVSAEFRKMSPLGKIPAFKDGDRVLADSSVICAYLERTRPEPALYPSEPYEYARSLWFEEYGDGGMTPVVGGRIFFPRVVGPRFMNQKTDEAAVQQAIDEGLPPLFDYLEREVAASGGEFLVGNRFSIADIGIATQFVNLRHAGVRVDEKRWPKLAHYIAGMHARPSFKALIEEEAPMFNIG